jgi:DNA-binding Lrp family transcriptional regulator
LGLKKRKQGHVSYLASKPSAVRGLREFDWFARRSWRNKELAVLWAVVYLGEKSGWERSRASLRDIAEVAGLNPKECSQALAKFFGGPVGNGLNDSEFSWGEKEKVISVLEKAASKLPTWTEELVMNAVCTNTGVSVADIYDSMLAKGLTIGGVYKMVERLKDEGYIYPERHFRVNERGPMRELLTADCTNCFYGYSNQDQCFKDTFRQLEGVLRRDYGVEPSPEVSSAMYASAKSMPYSSKVNRRVLASLRLMHEVERMVKEGHTSTLLSRIEEHYGIEFPLKTKSANSNHSS